MWAHMYNRMIKAEYRKSKLFQVYATILKNNCVK